MANRSNKSWTKAKVSWRKNFAPKRMPWYSAFNAHIEPRVGYVAIIIAAIFFFGGVFSLEKEAELVVSQHVVPRYSKEMGPESQLAASAAYITRLLHVPSGYTQY